ncbi:MAG TPA: prepilin-type N-terminal cleavage/methylation domain-containing protein [Thermoanaerobaculia bacterium]|nr:prepilin-type N-terminal cleavage/methylation domain-containing protein [Thermoanaerobaculia bacterium]
MSRRAGYTLIELVVAMAVFGFFLFVILSLTVELSNYERRLKIQFLRHPQIMAVLARMRRDVLDAYGDNPYGVTVDGYANNEKTLVVETLNESGGTQTVVWDLSTPGIIVRRAYNVGVVRVWAARAVPPEFNKYAGIGAYENKRGAPAVRLTAYDTKGRLAIDQIFFPRRTK